MKKLGALVMLAGVLLAVDIPKDFDDKGDCYPGIKFRAGYGVTERYSACRLEGGFKWVETRSLPGKLLRIIVPNKESGDMVIELKTKGRLLKDPDSDYYVPADEYVK